MYETLASKASSTLGIDVVRSSHYIDNKTASKITKEIFKAFSEWSIGGTFRVATVGKKKAGNTPRGVAGKRASKNGGAYLIEVSLGQGKKYRCRLTSDHLTTSEIEQLFFFRAKKAG